MMISRIVHCSHSVQRYVRRTFWTWSATQDSTAESALSSDAIPSIFGNVVPNTDSKEAEELYRHAIECYIVDGICSKSIALLDEAVALVPSFSHAHSLRGLLCILDFETAIYPPDSIKDKVKVCADAALKSLAVTKCTSDVEVNDRDNLYAMVLKAWTEGRLRDAAAHLELLLRKNPTDLLSIKLAHHTYRCLGDSSNLQDLIPRIANSWEESTPGFPQLLSLQAEGFAEAGRLEDSEEVGLKSISLESEEVGAIMAVASSLECAGKFREGLEILREFRDFWEPHQIICPKLKWLWSIFEIERGRYDLALARFDLSHYNGLPTQSLNDISNSCSGALDPTPLLKDSSWGLLESVSLLKRLECCNIGEDLKGRWLDILNIYNVEKYVEMNISPLHDIHLAVLFTATGKSCHLEQLFKRLERSKENHHYKNKTELPLSLELSQRNALTLVICKAISISPNNPGSAANMLRDLRYHWQSILGGTNVQRDMLNWIMLDCCVRSLVNDTSVAASEISPTDLGRELFSERLNRRANSPHVWRMYGDMLQYMEQQENHISTFTSAAAYTRAYDLGLGQGGSHAN